MPKITHYAPAWLCDPNAGQKLFEMSPDEPTHAASVAHRQKANGGPLRTIARRGTEVFVAVGRQIRWGNLAQIMEVWETKQGRPRCKQEDSDDFFEVHDEGAKIDGRPGAGEGYRIIKTPVADEIRQLIVSPKQDFLAVLTTHTVHICLLPDSSHLHVSDESLLKPRFWTLGPTTHVTSRSALASALWHPLGVNGSTMVTVTRDSVVRIWEISSTNRWSFDAPSLAIDLKRLADGTWLGQDFSASAATPSQIFSPDLFDMEVAAACFPTRSSKGWSPMTLWVAMTSGDVYALCPLLPKEWAPPPALIPSLSLSIVAKLAAVDGDTLLSAETKRIAQQQQDWMSDLDSQEPRPVQASHAGAAAEFYIRPCRPGSIPRLQGPFRIRANPDDERDEDVELKDILVIGQDSNLTDVMKGEDVDRLEDESEVLSLSVVCLLSTSGQVKICLDLEGVEAQWLPSRSQSRLEAEPRPHAPRADPPSLLAIQTLDTVKPAELSEALSSSDCWPTLSVDVASRFSFFVTHQAGITYISLASWLSRLESELSGESEAGADFRLGLLVKDANSERDRVYTHKPGQRMPAAATAIMEPDLGYFILSATHNDPIAVFMELPRCGEPFAGTFSPTPFRYEGEPGDAEIAWEPRPLFHPSQVLDRPSNVPKWLQHVKSSRRKALVPQVARLSAATLVIFHEGHKLISSEVFEVNEAVAELFRKCEALQAELRDQIGKADRVKMHIHTITGKDEDENADGEQITYDMLIKSRLRTAKDKQASLTKRVEALKKQFGCIGTRALSDKERAWMDEVQAMEKMLSDPDTQQTASPSKTRPAVKRLEEIRSLHSSLLAQARQLRKSGAGVHGEESQGSPVPKMRIPTEIRRAKVAAVMDLLERETELVDAVKGRLERLTIG